MEGYTVHRIKTKEARPWILKKHYAHRMPIVFHAFGLFRKKLLEGIITYGPSPSPHLVRGICGEGYKDIVQEFNRLCLEKNTANLASYFISKTFKLLPKPLIIVSYADSGQGHIGYCYQATNWLFTGSVTAHDSEFILNGKKTHSKSLRNLGITAPIKWAKKNDIEIIKPKPKHRYIYFLGSKTQKKQMLKALKYPILPYPKGETKRYDASAHIEKQVRLF